MNPLSLITTLLPLIIRLTNIIPQIQSGLKTGTSIFELLQKFSPDLINIVQGVAEPLFPNLTKQQQVQAGALIAFDPEQVKFVQDSLNRLKIPDSPLVVDGHYGELTKKAIEKFQSTHGLVVDGWGGSVTQAAIQSELVKLPPPPVQNIAPSAPVTGATK